MTSITDSRFRILLGFALAALMLATRGQQFAPLAHHLPDASLAVFFLAGLYLRSLWTFPALFVLATIIDLTAIGWGGVSSYCMSPAYWLLVPAYGAVWGLGRWAGGHLAMRLADMPGWVGVLLLGGVLAEVFASGGFYLYSGYFTEPSLSELFGRFATYMPATLLHLLAYAAVVLSLQAGWSRFATGVRSADVHPR